VQPSLAIPRRLFNAQQQVTEHSYFRVHIHPKRFGQAHRVDWHARILHNCDAYVVVNKPWGVQVPHYLIQC
jgi:23S rRNA-/tRNA-specific pseudouridylate synthase